MTIDDLLYATNGKLLVKACQDTGEIYHPKDWSPLTVGFVRSTLDHVFFDGAFNMRYHVVYGKNEAKK